MGTPEPALCAGGIGVIYRERTIPTRLRCKTTHRTISNDEHLAVSSIFMNGIQGTPRRTVRLGIPYRQSCGRVAPCKPMKNIQAVFLERGEVPGGPLLCCDLSLMVAQLFKDVTAGQRSWLSRLAHCPHMSEPMLRMVQRRTRTCLRHIFKPPL